MDKYCDITEPRLRRSFESELLDEPHPIVVRRLKADRKRFFQRCRNVRDKTLRDVVTHTQVSWQRYKTLDVILKLVEGLGARTYQSVDGSIIVDWQHAVFALKLEPVAVPLAQMPSALSQGARRSDRRAKSA